MIDYHSHILPGIDDGSKNIEESQNLISAEMKDGVTTIIATPHFYADRMSGAKYLEMRANAEAELRAHLTQVPNAPELRVGAEVYYFPGMAKADLLDQLCIQGTQTLLVEMPFAQWKESFYNDIEKLIYKRGFEIILAHVERYAYFQKDKEIWNAIMELPLTKQINAATFIKTGLFDKKPRWAMNFLKEHDHVVIGTDCHNMTNRKPNLLAGRRAIEKALGTERLNRIDEIGAELLEQESPFTR